MKFFITIFLLIINLTTLYGISEVPYPKNWKDFAKVTTPLSKIGRIPSCNEDVSSLPDIYQEIVSIYCAVKPEGPGEVEILVSDINSFKNRMDKHKNGTTFILHLKDLKLLFVTTWKNNKPLYGIYIEGGQDASNVLGSGLNPTDCRICHTGYGVYCTNGQCGTLLNNKHVQ